LAHHLEVGHSWGTIACVTTVLRKHNMCWRLYERPSDTVNDALGHDAVLACYREVIKLSEGGQHKEWGTS
jgi:hypothetical protein